MAKKADFNILMVGGRRTGKTSVLASFLEGYQTAFAGANLTLTAETGTIPVMHDKIQILRNVFAAHSPYDEFDPDVDTNRTIERIDYFFTMRITGKENPNYTLRFTDVPGEWFLMPGNAEVEELFRETNVMIIAIDTPHLMECDEQGRGYGRYHEAFNSTGVFTNNIMDKFLISESGFASKKMVLFMPLKCEKYFQEKRPDGKIRTSEIPDAIEKGYKNLLKHLQGEKLRTNCQVAIVPVQTMGNFVFSRFGEDENGYVIKHQTRMVPMYSLYCFPNERAYNEGLQPKYCEQPLAYILTYILKMAVSVGNAPTWWEKIKKILRDLAAFVGILRVANDKEIQNAMAEVSKTIEKSAANGFKIIQNPLNF